MKPHQPTIVLNALLLALALLCAAAVVDPLGGYVLAADRPAKEHVKSQDKSRSEISSGDAHSSAASGSPKQQSKGSGQPDKPSGNDGAKNARPTTPAKATSPALPQQSPTASPTPQASVGSITVSDQCGASGAISLTAAYSGSLTLQLTYHVTGDSVFLPTGVTWNHTFSGQTSSEFYLPLPPAPIPTDGSGTRINTYRVEMLSADPMLSNMTAKSASFDCENQLGTPTATSTATSTPTPSVVASVTATATVTSTPTVAPSATASPSSTPVPSETPTPTETSEPTPAASLTPSPSPTRVSRYGTRVSPDYTSNADPGTEVSYKHTITNTGTVPDVKAISVNSSLAWTVSLFTGDGETPLSDSDHDGLPDTGSLAPGQAMDVTIKLKVPDNATRGNKDVTTVTAFSTANPALDDAGTATDTTTVNGIITVSLSTNNVSFGDVSPLGSVAPGVPNLSSTPDELGAYYTKSGAVAITVSSNSAWTGTLLASENDGSAETIRIGDGDLQWRLAGNQGWNDFATAPSSFTSGSAGINSFASDYRLRILWDDDPGTFSSVVTYNLSQ